MNYPKVSIIILNWNGLEDTIECLESLKKITYSNYEVIVVDNGSAGNDVQVLEEKFGDYIHLIKNDKNYGFTGGNNIGTRYALTNSNPDYLLLLNNDTVVDPGFLNEMVKVAETDPAIGIAGGKVYYYDDPNRLQFVWAKINLWGGRWVSTPLVVTPRMAKRNIDRGQYNFIKEVDAVSVCCFLVKRNALEDIGLLDESYFSLWEEADYYIRARRVGYKIVYVPKARIWHKGEQSTKRVTDLRYYYLARNNFRFMRKHATRWQYRFFLAYMFGFHLWLMTVLYLISFRSLRVLLGYYRGVRDGVFNSEAAAKFYTGN